MPRLDFVAELVQELLDALGAEVGWVTHGAGRLDWAESVLPGAGIAAGGDDAEIGPRLLQHVHVEVSLGGSLLDIGHPLGATCERVLEEALRASVGACA